MKFGNLSSYAIRNFQASHLSLAPESGADLGLLKLVVMTNVFFNNQQYKIKIKRFICVKQTMSSFSVTAEINVPIHSICKA